MAYIRTEEKTDYTDLEHYLGKGNYRLQSKPESQYLIFLSIGVYEIIIVKIILKLIIIMLAAMVVLI